MPRAVRNQLSATRCTTAPKTSYLPYSDCVTRLTHNPPVPSLPFPDGGKTFSSHGMALHEPILQSLTPCRTHMAHCLGTTPNYKSRSPPITQSKPQSIQINVSPGKTHANQSNMPGSELPSASLCEFAGRI
jgi:hypothetical protein